MIATLVYFSLSPSRIQKLCKYTLMFILASNVKSRVSGKNYACLLEKMVCRCKHGEACKFSEEVIELRPELIRNFT
jgi:hypothetical protein